MRQPARIQPAAAGTTAPDRVIQRVLVVDDSRAHRHLISTVLRRWGFAVLTASDGPAALEILSDEPVDLVLSDWVMPHMTGLDLCRAFRDRADARYVYFILLTSKSAHEDVAAGLAAGADDFLTKPINPEELKARISAGERLVAMQRMLEERNAQLTGALSELQAVYDRLARDLVEARRLQQSLVPERSLSVPGADISLLLRPSGQIGGDLVGAFDAPGNSICVYSIDVSGHGIASALMTARLAGYLTGSSPENNVALQLEPGGGYGLLPLADVCARLNATILADMETELYFTMVLAVCDLTTGRVRLVQAGHPPPLVQRAGGGIEFIGEGGMPIGLLETAEFAEVDAVLAPGDRLLLYSDGFPEATDGSGGMLDQDGLGAMMAAMAGIGGHALLDELVWRLTDFTGQDEFEDDASAVLLEFEGSASGREA